jgi:carbon-monoxide dehydrogenase medium subunit
MKPPPFEYIRAETIEGALSLLVAHGEGVKFIAGGQSLMPMLAFRLLAPELLVDISRVPELRQLVLSEAGVEIGAAVRWCDIEHHPSLDVSHPLLTSAVRHVAHYQIRNRGTAGGSLAHADPAAELPGIAVACDATIIVGGVGGTRAIAAADFFQGALTTALEADEMIVGLHLPPWPAERSWAFNEFSRRRGDFAIVGVALFHDGDKMRMTNTHVGVIGVGDRPRRLTAVEDFLNDSPLSSDTAAKAGEIAAQSIEPDDDVYASADYRRALTATLIERAVCSARPGAHPS